MRDDLTVIYYTAHTERARFARTMLDRFRAVVGDLPVISVSQEPMDLGTNLCVGKVGVSHHNAHRQFQVGCQAATTRFVCSAEVDFLYPPEYFAFVPARDDVIYHATNVYALFFRRNTVRAFARRAPTEGAIMVGREHIIRVIEEQLAGLGQWNASPQIAGTFRHWFELSLCAPLWTERPLVTVKTDANMTRRIPFDHTTLTKAIPYWGTVSQVTDAVA